MLTATENGYGKRTPIVEYTRHGRGTKGMIAIQQTERNGQVVAAALVRPDDEVMLISTGGVLIRTKVKSIREMSRSTQGVTLINLDDGEKLAGLERVVETDDEATSDASARTRAMRRPTDHADDDRRDGDLAAPSRRDRRARPRDPRAAQRARARTRRRSARSRAAAPRTGPSARRRCCARLQARERGPAAERGGRRRVPPGHVGVPRARAAAARRLPRARRAPSATRRSPSISASSSTPMPLRDDRRGLPRRRERADRLRRRAGRELDRRRGRAHARPHVPDRRSRSAARSSCASSRTCCRTRPRSAEVTKVYSHAQSLAQCVQWLAQHLPAVPRVAGREQRRGGAARRGGAGRRGDRRRERRRDLRPRRCSRRTSRTSRTTRRASGCSAASRCRRRARDETSLVMSAPNRPGAVHALLEPLRDARRVDVAARVAPGAHRAVGVPVLRRRRRPSRRPAGRRRARRAARAARRSSSCWDRIRRRRPELSRMRVDRR